MGKNTVERDCSRNPWGKALKYTVTKIPAIGFTININSTHENTLIKAYFFKRGKT